VAGPTVEVLGSCTTVGANSMQNGGWLVGGRREGMWRGGTL
jgi:hypothetical protein